MSVCTLNDKSLKTTIPTELSIANDLSIPRTILLLDLTMLLVNTSDTVRIPNQLEILVYIHSCIFYQNLFISYLLFPLLSFSFTHVFVQHKQKRKLCKNIILVKREANDSRGTVKLISR